VSRWAEQLTGAGADVDAFRLPNLRRKGGQPVTDLCDLANVPPADIAREPCLKALFP
jgi:hypothetical protein